MNRRNYLAWMGVFGGALLAHTAWAVDEPSLEDTLKFGLRARRPIEFQFVAAVAKLTDEGKLPRAYVLAAFDYARKRRPHIPIPYFEFVVRKKAEELGVDIGVPNTLESL
jgi:hypothetical protein